MNNVTVKAHKTAPPDTANESAESYVGRAHARIGYPLEVRVQRGNNSYVQHLSTAEAVDLFGALLEVLPRDQVIDALSPTLSMNDIDALQARLP